ncbi:family 20 glycosylhydrolase [Mucilaginibacter sp.]|uniref:family 20 glycosylhydrolase n=1 Tax=Mucilaginibacter sp. TaxID=1882438 RepID=UPI003D09FC6A
MVNYRITALIFLFTALLNVNGIAQRKNVRYPIIPYPASLTAMDGNFIITPATAIVLPDKGLFKNEADILGQYFANSLGKPLKQVTGDLTKHNISLIYDATIAAPEGYSIRITPGQIILSAKTKQGMFMAVQSIRQLLPPAVEQAGIITLKSLALPAVRIDDWPAYEWRGMHLDVSRHFFSIAYIKKFINVMALYKMNKLHLHLTDDQGWRIEIKKYPKLTEQGAWRTFNNQDSACMKRAVDNPDFNIDPEHIIHKDGKTLYGGFYTQVQMKALVSYALSRHIDIIPEIDMPGHMMAAINAYPFLTCNGENKWGTLFTKPICPCNESTFEFAENVFTEIMDIFPSQYIHIGGDEVDRSDWAKSDACKELMKREGIKDLPALQSYFINRMEKFFNSKGRKMIGWDEIIEGGVSPSAIVMYWRTWVPKAPVEAAKNGNKVIMTPGSPLYFDAAPDKNSIAAVYNFAVVPKGLTDIEAKNIIGAQANIWTEGIPSEKRADYMYMPRMTALAEVLWTNHPDYKFYLQRLNEQYTRLDKLNVHYRLPDLSGFLESNVFTDKDTLAIEKPLPGLTIRYTLNGTLPQSNSAVLSKPLVIEQSQQIKVAAFKSDGSHGDIYDVKYQKQSYALPETAAHISNGLICKAYQQFYKLASLIPDTKPDGVFTVYSIVVPKAAEAPSFGLKYRGYLEIPQDGVYSFYLTCDDGGALKIAGREVVNNDGLHSAIEKSGQVALKKGLHNIALDFIEGGGGYTLKLKYSLNGSEPQDIPSAWLKN